MIPKVSVIVPVYNVERYLWDCLNALRAQTVSAIEIICVDDASTDASSALLAKAARQDARVKVLRHSSNLGLSAARNTGMQAASAPWLIFVDSDDLVSRRLCERTLFAADMTGADVVFYGHATFTDGSSPPPEPAVAEPVTIARSALLRLKAFAWTKLIRREFMQSAGIAFPEGMCFEDIPVHWRLVLESRTPVYLDERLVWYRQRQGSITFRTDWSRADSLRAYDLVNRQLVQSGMWRENQGTFMLEEMANFADTHTYYAVVNPDFVGRVRDEATVRMTLLHWSLALDSGQLAPRARDYILARCRPKAARRDWRQLMAMARLVSRDLIRRIIQRACS